jgi:hypothetical protein
MDPAFAFIRRYATGITELGCEYTADCDMADITVARCAQLVSITRAYFYQPSTWLGLTQLHTLRGVDLNKVSVATIAAALPRLHTLAAFTHIHDPSPTAVAGFFEDLLPRLSIFRFNGTWPTAAADAVATTQQPLPLLRELMWACRRNGVSVSRGFMGAQPVVLHTTDAVFAEWVNAATRDAPTTSGGALTRVRDLRFAVGSSPDKCNIARLLQSAPQLREFNLGWLDGGVFWYEVVPSFAGFLVHPRLRHIRVDAVNGRVAACPPGDCAEQLRRLCFPRLRCLSMGTKSDFFVTPLENPPEV